MFTLGSRYLEWALRKVEWGRGEELGNGKVPACATVLHHQTEPGRDEEQISSVEQGMQREVTVNYPLAVTGKGTSFVMKCKPGKSVFLAAWSCGTFKI